MEMGALPLPVSVDRWAAQVLFASIQSFSAHSIHLNGTAHKYTTSSDKCDQVRLFYSFDKWYGRLYDKDIETLLVLDT